MQVVDFVLRKGGDGPEMLCRRLLNQLNTRIAPPNPAKAPQNIIPRTISFSLATPNKNAERKFFPSAFNFKPQNVLLRITAAIPNTINAKINERGLNRESNNLGSNAAS